MKRRPGKGARALRTAQPTKPNDKALIAALLKYGAAIGTALTAYKLEPGGDCDRSAPIADRAFRRAHGELALAAALPAQTMEGLSAKARAVPFIFEDNDHSALSSVHKDYLKSFAADARRLAEANMEAAVAVVQTVAALSDKALETMRNGAQGGAK